MTPSSLFILSVALAACGATDDGSSMSGEKADAPVGYALDDDVAFTTGTGSDVRVQVYETGRRGDGIDFHNDVEIAVSYRDANGYFRAADGRSPLAIGAFARLGITRAHHGGDPTDESRNVWFTLESDGEAYVGRYRMSLTGDVGDNAATWRGAAFAFASEEHRWDSDYGRNYVLEIGASS